MMMIMLKKKKLSYNSNQIKTLIKLQPQSYPKQIKSLQLLPYHKKNKAQP